MIDLKKRGMIKSAVAMSLWPWLKSCVPSASALNGPKAVIDAPPQITYDIMLHGMFAIIIDDSGITLLPPHVAGETPHMYLGLDMAGSIAMAKSLTPGAYYDFLLPAAMTKPAPGPTTNVVVPLSQVRRSSVEPHCTIHLPWPHFFVPLRSVVPLCQDQPLFTDPTGLVCQPQQLPLVTMLRYQLSTSSGQNFHYKYHLFAEPNVCPGKIHPSEALDTLISMFKGIDKLTFNNCLTMNDLGTLTDPQELGVSLDDKMALVERLGFDCKDPDKCRSAPPPILSSCSTAVERRSLATQAGAPPPHLGIHPTACMSVVFTG
jgi:hypothetical protein